MKKITMVGLAIIILIMNIYFNYCHIEAEENILYDEKAYVDLIQKLVDEQNDNAWETYPDLFCNNEREMYDIYFSTMELDSDDVNGIAVVQSAALRYMYEIPSYYLQGNVNLECFTQVKTYIVGIEYSVSKITKNFYNGINFRTIAIGVENNKLCVICCQDVSVELLDVLYQKSMSDVALMSICEEKNPFDVAIKIRNARSNGYVIDADMNIIDVLDDDIVDVQNKYNSEKNMVSEYKYKEGYTQSSPYYGTIPDKIKICFVNPQNRKDAGTAIYTSNFSAYVINTFTVEYGPAAVESEPLCEAAFGAQLIITKQFALWYTLYYSLYPELGFDIKDYYDGQGDQDYRYNYYASLLPKYKNIVTVAMKRYYTHYLVKKKDHALFCTYYRSTSKKADALGYTALSQERMTLKSKQKVNTANILITEYQNGSSPYGDKWTTVLYK